MFQKLERGKLRLRPLKNIDCQLGVLETQTSAKLRVLSKVRTDWPDHSPTNHFDNEKCFFLKDLLKHHLLLACYLGFD